MALLGVHVHKLLDWQGNQSTKGENPFEYIRFRDGRSLAEVVPIYDPPHWDSKDVYRYISDNLSNWIEIAHGIRKAA